MEKKVFPMQNPLFWHMKPQSLWPEFLKTVNQTGAEFPDVCIAGSVCSDEDIKCYPC